MSEENTQVDLEKGTVTLKKGEQLKTFSLKSADDVNSLVGLGQRGWYFDDEASKELGSLRKVIQNWDSALEAARNSDEGLLQLKTKIEAAIGKPITKAEAKQIANEPKILLDDEEDSRLKNTIASLEEKIAKLEQSQNSFKKSNEEKELERLKAEISADADRLEKKYDGKDGAPKFNRQEIFDFASQSGIQDLELAFKMKNFDSLTEYAKKQTLKEAKSEAEKRKQGFVETGDQKTELNTNNHKHRPTYHKLGQDALKAAKNEGLSLFTDEV